jgi:transcriptional regulator with XRE-family HTH domain
MNCNNDVRQVLARNLKLLMHRRTPRWTQKELGKAAGVGQRTVGNMLRGATVDGISGATLDRIEAVACVFGLKSWQLTYPGLPEILDDLHSVTDVLTGFQLADNHGRELIHTVAEREAKYRTPHTDCP